MWTLIDVANCFLVQNESYNELTGWLMKVNDDCGKVALMG